jgi:hypothetical protein
MRLQRARIGGRRVRNFSSRGLCFEFWRVNDDYFELLVFIAVHSERGNWGQLRCFCFYSHLCLGEIAVSIYWKKKRRKFPGQYPQWSRLQTGAGESSIFIEGIFLFSASCLCCVFTLISSHIYKMIKKATRIQVIMPTMTALPLTLRITLLGTASSIHPHSRFLLGLIMKN